MKKHDIKRIKRQLAKGNPELRRMELETILQSVNQNITELQTEKNSLQDQYQQEYRTWFKELLAVDTIPVPHDTQLRQAAVCLLGGTVAAAIEVFVAGTLARRWGISPLLPCTLALLLPLVLKTAIAAYLHDEDRPHESLRLLQLYLLGPMLGLFALAVLLLFLARVIPDDLALWLLPLLNLAPLALGVSCLGLAAGLFSQWHYLSWSKAVVRKYRQVALEETATRELLHFLEAQQRRLNEQPRKLSVVSASVAGLSTVAGNPWLPQYAGVPLGESKRSAVVSRSWPTQSDVQFVSPPLPQAASSKKIHHLLERVEQLADDLKNHARTGDLMALSNAGFVLAATLADLWAKRSEREADWGDLLNLLQGALSQDEFERYTVQQCTAIKEIINKHLAADEVTLDDLESSIKLLREAGLDPWKGISGNLSE